MLARAIGHAGAGRPGSHAPRGPSIFDRLAETAARLAGHPGFFAVCSASVLVWVMWGPSAGFSDTWQLVINTATTIVTFLIVALLQNSARRSDRAVHAKLDAIADALADFMAKSGPDLDRDVRELVEAVGLEKRERSD